jgi:tetratricopeptide (TPR) repeat protein
LNNIGCTLYELDELEGARLAFEEALDIQRESLRGSTIREDPAESKSSFNQLLLSVAATLCNIASIKVRWSRYDEASLALEEALLVSVATNLPMRSTMKSYAICL